MLMPLWIIDHLPLFLFSFPEKVSPEQAISFLIYFGIIAFFPWQKASNTGYENENIPTITTGNATFYASVRVIFLVIYEWFFRGLLLISFAGWLGVGPAIVINILLYTLGHIHKNKAEIIGCIPLGLLLCAFTIWWQSIWPAIIFHLQIAIINEWPPLKQFISPQKQAGL